MDGEVVNGQHCLQLLLESRDPAIIFLQAHTTSSYKASYPAHVVYLRIRPTSGAITQINGYAFTSSSSSCPYGAHA